MRTSNGIRTGTHKTLTPLCFHPPTKTSMKIHHHHVAAMAISIQCRIDDYRSLILLGESRTTCTTPTQHDKRGYLYGHTQLV